MKVVKPPKFKKDWVGKYLVAKRKCQEGQLTPPHGIILSIDRRLNAQETMHSSNDVSRWGKVRILSCSWRCLECGAWHQGYMPESWIEEGLAVFVEKE